MPVYISGPITGVHDDNRPAFADAAARLRARGYPVVNPHELPALHPDALWTALLRRDLLAMLATCTSVATLPDSGNSVGATLEQAVARSLHWPVLTLDEALDRNPDLGDHV